MREKTEHVFRHREIFSGRDPEKASGTRPARRLIRSIAPQSSEVTTVVLGRVVALRRFQDLRNPREPIVEEQPPERFIAQRAFADVGVPVATFAEARGTGFALQRQDLEQLFEPLGMVEQ